MSIHVTQNSLQDWTLVLDGNGKREKKVSSKLNRLIDLESCS